MTELIVPPLLVQLLERLEEREGLELEFKSAQGGLPKSLWPTVSAFANTSGGWIVLGISEHEGTVAMDGVTDPQRLVQTFYNLVRDAQKISRPVCGPSDVTTEPLDGVQVVIVRVPAASRRVRPVYLNGNPYGGTYVRRAGGDYHATKPEVDRMMREASDVSADSAVLARFTIDDLDRESVARYRRRYQTLNPASPRNAYDDLAFLRALGAYGVDREQQTEGLTVAGLLLLGTPTALREWRPRHLIDYRRLAGDPADDRRWEDRVVWEGNLLGAFETLLPRLV